MTRDELLEQMFRLLDQGFEPIKISQSFEYGVHEAEVQLLFNRERAIRGPKRVEESPASDGDIIDVECLGEEWGDPLELTV